MEEESVDEEELASKQRKADAQKEKEAGNAAYKARQFEKAIQHYDRAVELDDSDISFLTNRQAEPSKATLVLQESMPFFSMPQAGACCPECCHAVHQQRPV